MDIIISRRNISILYTCFCTLALRLDPDAALVQQVDLSLDNLLAVLSMLHRLTLQVEIFGIDRLLIEQLVKLGAQIFKPVIPLCSRSMVAQSLDIDHASHIR